MAENLIIIFLYLGSADSGISVESTVIHPKEYDVVAEIIDTEAKYVEDLHKVIQVRITHTYQIHFFRNSLTV